jgi:hypothetical protein
VSDAWKSGESTVGTYSILKEQMTTIHSGPNAVASKSHNAVSGRD